MRTPEQMYDVIEKQAICIARQKAVVITAFLNKCGEHATWEEWLGFYVYNIS